MSKSKFHPSYMNYEAKWLPVCSVVFYLFKRSGFNMTSSGETSNCPVRTGILLSISSFANANGVVPFRLSQAVELM